MRKFKRYIVRDKETRQAVDTVVFEVGKRLPKVAQGLYIAECCGRYEVETPSYNIKEVGEDNE